MVANRSATPQERNVVAATVKKLVAVDRPSRKKIAKGTAIPITTIPTISRGPDTQRFYLAPTRRGLGTPAARPFASTAGRRDRAGSPERGRRSSASHGTAGHR